MKITITPTGEISMETNGSTPAEVAGTVLAIQRELHKKEVNERPAHLNDVQGATYDFLVSRDHEAGVHVSAIGAHFMITNGAAGQRCYELVKMGLATKIINGRYRAVTE